MLMQPFNHFSPADLGPQLWYKAETLQDVVADAGAITTWTNQGLAGSTQDATGVNSPTYQENVRNGRPVVRFVSASSQHFTIPDFAYGPGGNPVGLTAFVAMKHSDDTSAHTTFGQVDFTAQRAWVIERENTAANDGQVRLQVSADGNAVNAKVYDGGFRPKAAWHIAVLHFDAGTLRGYHNGVKQNPDTSFTDGTVASLHNSTAVLQIGAAISGGTPINFLDGDIGELLMYDVALSDFNRRQVVEYLSHTYDIERRSGQFFQAHLMPSIVADFNAEQGGDDFSNAGVIVSWPSWHDEGASATPDFVQTVTARKPTFTLNVINGRPVVVADGGDDMNTTGSILDVTNPFTIIGIWALTNEGADRSLVAQQDGTGTGQSIIRYDFSDDDIVCDLGSQLNATTAYVGGPAVFTVAFDGTNISFRLNGAADGSGARTPAAATGNWILFANKGLLEDWIGNAARLVMFDRALETEEIVLVEAVLNDTYAIF